VSVTARIRIATAPALAAAVLLAGCGGTAPGDTGRPTLDPAILAAIWSPLMVDPALGGLDRDAQVVSGDDSARVAVPLVSSGPEAANAARAEALKLAGGTITPAPAPADSGASGAALGLETAAQIAAASGPGGAACAKDIEYSARWAAMLPAALEVYPRGAVQDAAGSDRPGCGLRVVSFVSAVEPRDIVDFYYTRVRKAGFDARHRLDGETHVLAGRNGKASYLIHVRPPERGLTEVDLVSSGG